jgi:hypothetical protein
MESLTDGELLDTYQRAKNINCSPEFILLLFGELKKRNLEEATLINNMISGLN